MRSISHKAAKAEAKRIVEVALAKHGTPKKSDDFAEIIRTIENEAYKWRMVAATAIYIYHPGGPKWPEWKKAEYVEAERETTRRIYAHLEPMIEKFKLGFREAVAEWNERYNRRHRKA